MTGAIAHDQAERLRAAFDRVLGGAGSVPDEPDAARVALERLVEVLESSPAAVVFPSDATISTGQAADLLGVSRMTVVRLIDRGEIATTGGGTHRRIAASELARYRTASTTRRRSALQDLAGEIGEDTPPDQIISTR